MLGVSIVQEEGPALPHLTAGMTCCPDCARDVFMTCVVSILIVDNSMMDKSCIALNQRRWVAYVPVPNTG